ncbi:uncharacterized protein MONBRDRAFT_4967 [Monosiga brevicollis MX1]|uniref:Uncharacterized protein n=1 Tax=Monosiga brevicollis TaxID=81824 RepID=A9UPH6_MONBE|nr:uncharacterized protein MONBRDRAFT_4967 [Monosiga brevicollis MX1]EDQ92424.1 predicted protein [Monosiga brevicollis MX1]|eukprot:XP_001742186.1 hypothetical protein [Monosiga brevicollis MX1]
MEEQRVTRRRTRAITSLEEERRAHDPPVVIGRSPRVRVNHTPTRKREPSPIEASPLQQEEAASPPVPLSAPITSTPRKPATLPATTPSPTPTPVSPPPAQLSATPSPRARRRRGWWRAVRSFLEDYAMDYEYWFFILVGLVLSGIALILAMETMVHFNLASEGYQKHGILHFAAEHLPDAILATVAAIPAYLLSVYADRKRKMAFARLEFYKCINFSLNWFEHPRGERTLYFSTLLEQNLTEMTYNNPLVNDYVLEAAAQTTEDDCLMFADPGMEDSERKQLYTPIMKAAQNAVACRFGQGALHRVAGNATHCVTLIMAFTCERGPQVPQTKIRIMLCEDQLLREIQSYTTQHGAQAQPPRFLTPSHAPRWSTLCQMARVHAEHPRILPKVRIYLPRSAEADKSPRRLFSQNLLG